MHVCNFIFVHFTWLNTLVGTLIDRDFVYYKFLYVATFQRRIRVGNCRSYWRRHFAPDYDILGTPIMLLNSLVPSYKKCKREPNCGTSIEAGRILGGNKVMEILEASYVSSNTLLLVLIMFMI